MANDESASQPRFEANLSPGPNGNRGATRLALDLVEYGSLLFNNFEQISRKL